MARSLRGSTLTHPVGLGFEHAVLHDRKPRCERVAHPARDVRQFMAKQRALFCVLGRHGAA